MPDEWVRDRPFTIYDSLFTSEGEPQCLYPPDTCAASRLRFASRVRNFVGKCAGQHAGMEKFDFANASLKPSQIQTLPLEDLKLIARHRIWTPRPDIQRC